MKRLLLNMFLALSLVAAVLMGWLTVQCSTADFVELKLDNANSSPWTMTGRTAMFIHLAATLAFLLFPACRLLLYLRGKHHVTQRLCAVCGYDLRATPSRCPECGTAAAGTLS